MVQKRADNAQSGCAMHVEQDQSSPHLSAVVVAHNEEGDLEACLSNAWILRRHHCCAGPVYRRVFRDRAAVY